MIDVNTFGALLCLRASVQRMSAKHGGKGGSIVMLSSMASPLGGGGEYVWYAAAKAGIASMTLVLARELAKAGVRVNAICPVARTRLTETVMSGDRLGEQSGDLDVFGPENVAAIVGWLASDLSDGISGQVVKVQGGLAQIVEGWRPITQVTSEHNWTIETIAAQKDGLDEPAVRLAPALGKLHEPRRYVIRSRFFDGLSFEEISRRTGKSAGALRVLSVRAMEQLREIMEVGS